jgi:hypothetical protein
MRIAFDMDGVLADLHTAYVKAAVALFPDLDRSRIAAPDVGASPPVDATDGPEPEAADDFVVTRRQSQAIWKHLGGIENFWETLGELESGMVATLAATAQARRWDVLFITSRPGAVGETIQRQTQRWLRARGFEWPSVYVVRGSRGRIAQALDLDVVVDDRPDNCLDVVLESHAGAVLIWRGEPTTVPASARRLGIAVSPSVEACLEVLIAAESEQAGGGSLLDRLRRLFGLRTRPASGLLRRGASTAP